MLHVIVQNVYGIHIVINVIYGRLRRKLIIRNNLLTYTALVNVRYKVLNTGLKMNYSKNITNCGRIKYHIIGV